MSVRDTGWRGRGTHRRDAGRFRLAAYADGSWRLDFDGRAAGGICCAEGVEPCRADAKRAAEEALRKLCRDTLAALETK